MSVFIGFTDTLSDEDFPMGDESNIDNIQAVVKLREQELNENVDHRSVYVGNVDYGATAKELEAHFRECGEINRVTIICDKYDGHPKGFAYVEFSELSSAQAALSFEDSLFRGRQLKVRMKRINQPQYSGNRPGRGSGTRGRAFRGRSYGSFPRRPF